MMGHDNHLRWICSSVLLLLLQCSSNLKVISAAPTMDLTREIQEESPSGTVLANLAAIFNIASNEIGGRSFRMISQSFKSGSSLSHTEKLKGFGDMVSLNGETGEITLNRKIDRDEMCGKAAFCVIQLRAVMLPQRYFSMLNLNVIIADLNDNTPIFPANTITVNVSENAQLGSPVSLNQYQATDSDSGNNSMIHYSLSNDDVFNLDQGYDEAGRPYLNLIVAGYLDHEMKEDHYLTLTASDSGFQPHSGRASLHIRVLDANDNAPSFEKSEYRVQLSENLEPGNVIDTVVATDNDSGDFGRVVYRIVPDDPGSELISIHNQSGTIRLKSPLDRETHDGIRIGIEAEDCGGPGEKQVSRTTLILHVKDVNDNAPVITINFIEDYDQATNTAYVKENVPVGTYVAFASVIDQDQGRNGQHTTTITTKVVGSEGDSADTGHFTLGEDGLIQTGRLLDREKEDKYTIELKSCDDGVPPKCTYQNRTIQVLDENDNPPIFKQPIYSVTLSEDAQIGTYVTTVRADDLDSSKAPVYWKREKGEGITESRNGDIIYSLDDESSETFAVDRRTGRITLKAPLDYEQRQNWKITVRAEDEGMPSTQRAECILKVRINDVNDNSPVFVKPSADNMTVYATTLRKHIIIAIKTTDADSDKKVRLQLVSVNGSDDKQVVDGRYPFKYFILQPDTGYLRLNLTDDNLPYIIGTHKLHIRAFDTGNPPRKEDITLNVKVITDELPPGMYGSEPITEDFDGSFFTSLEFIIIVALAAASVLIIIIITMIVVKCRNNNKKVRTYNCRDAECANGWLPSGADHHMLENTTATTSTTTAAEWHHKRKSLASHGGSSHLTADSDEKFGTNESVVSSKARHVSDSGISCTPCSYSEYTLTSSRHDAISGYPGGLERRPTSLGTFSTEGMVHGKNGSLPQPHRALHNDGDSGRGDSDPDAANSDVCVNDRGKKDLLIVRGYRGILVG